MDNVTWPGGFQIFTFGKDFIQRMHNVTFPSGIPNTKTRKNYYLLRSKLEETLCMLSKSNSKDKQRTATPKLCIRTIE